MKININNLEKLTAAIEAAQSRAKVRTISTEDVISAAAEIEEFLKPILHKKHWTGLKFYVNPNAQAFPNSYNGNPESTQFVIQRFSSGWFVTEIERTSCGTREIWPMNLREYSAQIAEKVCEWRG